MATRVCDTRFAAATSPEAEQVRPQTQVSSVLVRVLLDVLRLRGVAFEALSIDGADRFLSDPAVARLPLSNYQALLGRAIQLSGEPALGLQCGLSASESSFGLMGPLISHSPTLRQAIELIAQFHELLIDDVRVQLSESTGTAHLRCKFDAAVGRSVAELIVAGLVRMLRTFGCGETEIHAVCFEHTRPAYYHAYAAAFCGTERFAQPFTGIDFDARSLDRPHIHWQPELQALIRAQAERGLEQLWRPLTYAERVRALMRNRRDPQGLDMASASRELGLSTRSLRRRLEEEGTSYRALIQSMLHESACSMLRNPALTLQAIAYSLGFADASTFHRAFMRWRGLTPGEYREEVRGARESGELASSGDSSRH